MIIKPTGRNSIIISGEEFDITPSIQYHLTNTRPTTKSFNKNDKESIYQILKDVGFRNSKHSKGSKSANMKDAL